MPHLPVMFAETLHQLNIKANGTYIDCTFGRGGHSTGILNQLDETGRLIALDRDQEALTSSNAQTLLQDKRVKLLHHCFSQLDIVAQQEGLSGEIDGILFDLGVSSPQLDTAGRGFSFMYDGPLDMRMDTSKGISASQWLADVDETKLTAVLKHYGEERFAKRIAHAIITYRSNSSISTTGQLATLIANAMPVKEKHKHPATRSFQAIRIFINQELDELQQGLQQAINLLKPGGRLVVISFHSLEDRIVKQFIRDEAGAKYDPGKLPIKESDITRGKLKKIGKAIKPSPQEILANPRARSAVLRSAERVS